MVIPTQFVSALKYINGNDFQETKPGDMIPIVIFCDALTTASISELIGFQMKSKYSTSVEVML